MFSVFDQYILKNAFAVTFVTALSLTLIILLTQSIRYLELVISSDASAYYFLVMMGLAIPKFLEAILPLAFAIGCVYTAQRLRNDRETVIMMAAGAAASRMARGFLVFAGLMMVFQFILSGWLAPIAVEQLQKTRGDIKSNYATLMFREGVFNTLRNGLTVFVESRTNMNQLNRLMIYDDKGTINQGKITTLFAARGIVNISDMAQQLLIYNGTQYIEDKDTGQISKLDFDQYTLDIPMSQNDIVTRWQEPDERKFQELFIAEDTNVARDLSKKSEFIAEIHKRVTTPFLYASYITLIIILLFMGEWNRRESTQPIVKVGIAIIIIQALYIVLFSEAKNVVWMNIFFYVIAAMPFVLGWLYISYRERKA